MTRSRRLVWIFAAVAFVLIDAGLLALIWSSGSSHHTQPALYAQPRGEPKFDLVVTALDTLTFDAAEYHVPAGVVVRITLTGAAGTTLLSTTAASMGSG